MSAIEHIHAASPVATGPEAAERSPLALGRVRAVAVTVVGALVVNLMIWGIGAAAGGSFEFTDGGKTMSAAPGGVVIFTVVPLVIGVTLAALVSYRWLGVIRVAQVLGSAIAVLTIGGTVAADFDVASTAALAAMHLVAVPILILGLETMRRRLVASTPSV